MHNSYVTLAFHHAVRGEDQDLAATIGRLRELTATGDFAYFTDIAHFMAGLPLPEPAATRWTKNDDDVRSAWRDLSGPGRNTSAPETDPLTRDGPDQTWSGPSLYASKGRAPHQKQPTLGRCAAVPGLAAGVQPGLVVAPAVGGDSSTSRTAFCRSP
ncbi:hypothetical protein [Streptomyces sp. NPDC056730]|uniref:hypothetical protein n=1 Tax=unclassified Streptomyces TaxID=2593676 RepID=UPI003657715A